MQILHRFAGSIQRYSEELSDPGRYRPDHFPQCEAPRPLRAHGFYTRTLVNIEFGGVIRVRRYLCCCCKRTVSLLPEFALPYLRFGIVVIALFLAARLLLGLTLKVAAESAKLAAMPYQRGQSWVRRFRQQAEKLCAALAALMAPPAVLDFTSRALQMWKSIGWIAAHRFLFADLRVHLLGWPAFLAPDGRLAALPPAAPSART
jgi:hypothetical protein